MFVLRIVALSYVLILISTSAPCAEPAASSIAAPSPSDWAEWRGGPHKTGEAGPGPKLISALPPGANTPRELWCARGAASWTDPVVAQGRVILTDLHKLYGPVEWRMIPSHMFVSHVGAMFVPGPLGRPPFFEASNLGTACARHVSMLTAKKLLAIKDRRFESVNEFTDWCATNGIGEDELAKLNEDLAGLGKPSQSEDVVTCLDAATGQKLWERRFPGVMYPMQYQVYSTAAVADGRVYYYSNRMYCLDLASGRTIWQSVLIRTADGQPRTGDANPLVVDGVVMVNHRAWDAATGKELWFREGDNGPEVTMPAVWRHGQRNYVLAQMPGRPRMHQPNILTCIDPKTGRVFWGPKDGFEHSAWSTIHVSGDLMAHTHRSPAFGVAEVWRLSLEKPTLLWSQGKNDYGAACTGAVAEGKYFVYGNDKSFGMACFDLQTGDLLWQTPEWLTKTNVHCGPFMSMAAADGKVFAMQPCGAGTEGYSATKNGRMHVIDAAARTYRELFSWPVDTGLYWSPVIARGRMYLKTQKGLVCYDLRADGQAAEQTAGPATPVAPPPQGTAPADRLASPFLEDREAARASFEKLTPEAKKDAVPQLLALLKRSDWFAQESAAKALVHVGPAAADAADEIAGVARRGLIEKDLARAGVALDVLGVIGAAGEKAVAALTPEIRTALDYKAAKDYWRDPAGLFPVLPEPSPCADVNRDGWADGEGLLPLLGSPGRKLSPAAQAALVPLLAKLLGDPKENVRANAAFSLRLVRLERKSPGPAAAATPELVKVVCGHDKTAAEAAARVLGEIGGKEVVGPLEAALKDSDPRVARAAAEGLGAMGLVAKPAIPALAAALRHENEFVVYGAAGALMDLVPQAIGLDEAVTMIGQVVADGNVTVMARRKAADVLRLIGYDARPAVPLILPCLGEDDKELPMRVSEVIGQAGVDARSLPALMAMLKGGNPRAVTQAANVFSRLGAVGKAAVPDLVAVLARGGLDAASAAANALRRIGKDAGAAVPGLIELVSGADTKRAAMAARALGGIGADALPAIPVLEKAEAGPDKDLAEAAKGALGWLRYIKDGPKKGPPASSGPSAEWTANWPAFRGPDNSGVCRFKDIPDQWDEAQKKNIAWKVKIPLPGLSSPVVWGNRVYVTGATRQKREMYCFDGASGRLLWTGTYKSDPLAPTDYKVWQSRENALHASPTPVVDGQRVFGYYANGEVACFDAKTGRCLWSKYLGSPEGNTYGLSNSLLLYRNTLIVLFQGRNSRLVGLDAANGNEQWSSRQADASWASPLLLQGHGRAQIVVAANPHVSGWDAETGDNLWKAKLLKKGYAAPSPIVAGGKVLACLADCGMFAIKPEGKGDVTQTHVAWKIEDLENTGFPDATSPVSQGELVWVYSNEFLVCIDAKTGKVHYERDLGEGTSFASPMIAGGRLYAFGKTTTFVVEAGRVFKLSGKCKLSEPIDCSPAFAPGRIYVRTEGHLCAIGTAPPSPAAPPEPSISQSAEAGKPAHAETAKTVRTPTKPAPKEMTGRITVPPLPEPFKDGVSTVWHVRGVVLESEEKDPGGVEIRGVYKATLDEAGKQAARIIVYRDPWWHIRALRVETEQSGPDGKRRTASRVISPPDENRGRLGFSGPDAEFAIRGLLMAKPLRAEIVAAKEAGPETSQRFMVKQLAAYGKNLEIKPPGKTK